MNSQTRWLLPLQSDSARSIALDQDPEAVYFIVKETWVEWDAQVREDLVQQAAEQYVTLLEWRNILFI
jgi:hypothetical protein